MATYAPLSSKSEHGGSEHTGGGAEDVDEEDFVLDAKALSILAKVKEMEMREEELEEGGRTDVETTTTSSSNRSSRDDGDATSASIAGEHASRGEEEMLDESSPLGQRLSFLFKSAMPVVISFFLSVAGSFINLMFAGHLEEANGVPKSTVFAAISMANMFCNVSFRSLIIGMTGAVETLGSQNNGAKNYREVGLTLQRSVVVLSIITIPCFFVWWHCEQIFKWLGIDPGVSAVVGTYVRIRIVEMPFGVINESWEKYLMSIGLMTPPMFAAISFNLGILLLGLLNAFVLHGSYEYLAYNWVACIILSGVVMISLSWREPSVQRTLQPLSLEALHFPKLLQFSSLGLPGTAMLCSEWWAYEALSLFAAWLGTKEVAAQTIIMQTASLSFMIPLGLSIATASIVGNALGAGKRAVATQMGKLALTCIFFIELFICAIIMIFGRSFVSCFTDDAGVIDVADHAMLFLSFFCIFDGMQGVSSGILRGSGKQAIGACTNIFAFYALGLPCAYALCFRLHLGVPGLLMGISIGTLFQVCALMFLILCKESYVYVTVAPGGNIASATLATEADDEEEAGNSKGKTIELAATGERLNNPLHSSSTCNREASA